MKNVEEKLYEDLYQGLPLAYFIINPDRSIIDCNQGALNLLGYSKREILNLNVLDLYSDHPEGKAKALKLFTLLLSGEKIVNQELVMKHKDGHEIWINLSLIPKLSNDGKVIASRSIALDITEKKAAEIALIESECLISTILDNLIGIVYRCQNNRNWTMESLSKGCHDLTEYNPNELLQDSIISYADLIHPDDREYVWTNVQKAISSGNSFFLNYRIITKSGRIKWVLEQGREIELEKGNKILSGFITDISKQITAENNLKKSTVLLNSVIDQNANPMWISDNKGNLIRINDACCKLINVKAEEVIGKYNIFRDNIVESQGFIPLVKSVFNEGNTVNFILKYNSSQLKHLALKNFTKIILEVSIFPIKDENEKIVNAVITHRDITKETKLKNDLKTQIDFTQKSLDAQQDTFLVFEVENGQAIKWNKAFKEISEYSDEEISFFRAPQIYFDQMELDLLVGKYHKISEGSNLISRLNLITKTKKKIPFEYNLSGIFNDKGKLEFIVAVGRDIRKIRDMEAVLNDTEEKYRLIADNVKDVIWTMDLNLNLTYISPSVYDLGGYKAEEVLKKSIQEFMTPDSFSLVTKLFKKEISPKNLRDKNHNPVISIEIEQYHKDGYIVPVEVKMNLLRDSSGKPIQILGINRNITERKKSETHLRESEEKYRLLAEDSDDLITLYNHRYEIEYRNFETHSRILGYPKKKFFHPSFQTKIIHKDDVLAYLSNIRKTEKEGDTFSSELRYKHKEGHYIWFTVTGKFFGDDLRHKKLLVVARNISEIKKANLELIKSKNDYMEAYHRVSFYKDIFTHDINNILQGFISGLQLSEIYLDIPEKSDLLKENFKILKEQILRGVNLASNIRKISKIDEDEIRLERVDVNILLQKVEKFIEDSYREKKVRINLNLSDFPNFVMANELLEDVFENVLINSIIHNDSAIKEVKINVSRDNKEIEYVIIEFIDNGIGIEDERKESIFYRGYKDKGSIHGMGLGLSLVKQIIDSFKGKIWVEDRIKGEPSKGSKFFVMIPIFN